MHCPGQAQRQGLGDEEAIAHQRHQLTALQLLAQPLNPESPASSAGGSGWQHGKATPPRVSVGYTPSRQQQMQMQPLSTLRTAETQEDDPSAAGSVPTFPYSPPGASTMGLRAGGIGSSSDRSLGQPGSSVGTPGAITRFGMAPSPATLSDGGPLPYSLAPLLVQTALPYTQSRGSGGSGLPPRSSSPLGAESMVQTNPMYDLPFDSDVAVAAGVSGGGGGAVQVAGGQYATHTANDSSAEMSGASVVSISGRQQRALVVGQTRTSPLLAAAAVAASGSSSSPGTSGGTLVDGARSRTLGQQLMGLFSMRESVRGMPDGRRAQALLPVHS